MKKTSKKDPTNRVGKVPVSFRPDRGKWELTVYHRGKRTRTLHESPEDALKAWRDHRRKIDRHGTQGESISREEGLEFIEAKRIVDGHDLRDVAAFWKNHHPDGSQTMTVDAALREFLSLQNSRSLSGRHSSALDLHCGRFATDFSGRQIRSVSRKEVLDWLRALDHAPRTVENHRDSLSTWFNWAARNGIVKESAVETITLLDLPTDPPKPKGVLNVGQSSAMMDHLAAHYPRYVPWHALQLFAGIRRAEAGRMTWDMIDVEGETITLPGWSEGGERIVKTGDDWVLHDLPANLWLWLKAFRDDGRIRVPGNDACNRIRGKEFPHLTPPIPAWPQNAMRHTFCTMLMSLHGDAAKVANWSRHTNASQLYRSYVAKLVSREEARRFTEIHPARHPGTSRTR